MSRCALLKPFFSRLRSKVQSRKSQIRSSRILIIGVLLVLSVLGGTGVAQTIVPDPAGLVDIVPPEFQLGQELYLENCASCHVGLPPATMPTETWRTILTEPNHYGVQITPFTEPSIYIVWNYISRYSRPIREGEPVPYRLRSSRYFRILHPTVEFGDRITVHSCATCHPAAEQFNYRTLTTEWEDSP
jgi:hypothetical protein